MMRNQLHYVLLLLVFFTSFQRLSAQDILAKAKETAIQTVSTRATDKRNAMDARKHFIQTLNKYQESLNVANEPQTINESSSPAGSYDAYLGKMKSAFQKKLATLVGNDDVTLIERARLRAGLNMVTSVKCLSGQDQSVFIPTKDNEGNEIVAFPIDEYKKNTRFGKVDNFREGFALFSKDQVFGYLSVCGDEVVTAQYRKAEPFNGGRAIVKRVDWYYIDGEGNESEPLENINDAKALIHGVSLATMANGKQALINNDYDITRKTLSDQYDGIESFHQNQVFKVKNGLKVGLVTVFGKVKLDATFDFIEPTAASGVYKVSINKMVGLMDSAWDIRIKPEYTDITNFNKHGLAVARTTNGAILIQKGTFKTTKVYASISDFNEYGVAIIKDETGKFGLIDTEMKVVVEPKYFSLGNFNEIGLANACIEANKCGFIKFDGTEQIKADFESVGAFNSFGLTVAKMRVDCKGAKCASDVILDRNGNIIVPATEESTLKDFKYTLTDSLHSGNFIMVNVKNTDSKANQFMLIDKTTLQLITGTSYEAVTTVDAAGNIRIKKNGMWGIIDIKGVMMCKPQYLDMGNLGENLYAVKSEKGKWGYINKKGKVHIPFEYEEVSIFNKGLAAVSKGKNKWGVISTVEAKVVPCVFKSINRFANDTKYEVTDADGTIYVVNDRGECESNCTKFEDIRNKANKQE
jgi:hypothetical protein